MFNSLDFSFDGQFSGLYNLKIASIGGRNQENTAYGPSYNILEERVRGRDVPFFFGVEASSNLSFDITFIHVSDGQRKDLDKREVMILSKWLIKKEYKKFRIFDEEYGRATYYVIFSNPKRVELGNMTFGLQVTATLNAPYGFLEEEFSISTGASTTQRIIIPNSSLDDSVPFEIYFTRTQGTTSLSWSVTNLKGTKTCTLANIQAGEQIYYNSDMRILSSNIFSRFSGFNFEWLAFLANQQNTLSLTGQGNYVVKYRTPMIM
jgi:hypothetical protein